MHQNGPSIASWGFLTGFRCSNGEKVVRRGSGKRQHRPPSPINYLWGWSKGGPVQPVHIRTCAQGSGSASRRRAGWGEAHTLGARSPALAPGSGHGVAVLCRSRVAGRQARIIRGSLSWVDWPKGGKPGDVSSISTSPHPGPARAAIPHGNDRIEKQACSLGAVAPRLQVTPRPTLIGRHTAAKASVSLSAAFPQ